MEYEEINLIDYLRIILKRKKIILVFLLIGVILAWAVTLSLPKNYKAETFLEIGDYSHREERYSQREKIISPFEFIEKINYGFYGSYPGLKAEIVKSTDLIKISIIAKNTKEAEDSLISINGLILEEHNKKLEEKKENLEKNIKELEEIIQSLSWKNQQIALLELEIYYIKKQMSDFQLTKDIRKPTIVFSREPNLPLNLIFGGTLGAFLAVFLIFYRNWWQKNKEKLR